MTELVDILYDNRTGQNPIFQNLKPEDWATNQIIDMWYINIMPNNTLSSNYIVPNKLPIPFKPNNKYKLWGFKYEFLKSYQYIIENKIAHGILEANSSICHLCNQQIQGINKYYLYRVYDSEHGRFCWGSLLWHLVLEHDYKPPRFFIEFIYNEYIKATYGPDTIIMKLDENSLKHFDIISRTGYENKIDYVDDKFVYENGKHNIEYMGDIITQCYSFDMKLPDVKSRIKNTGIFFGEALIKNDDEIRIKETEREYIKEVVNYIYYVHPYNSRATEDINYYNKFKIDIPKFDDYKSFVSLMSTYTNLLGLILFANEGIYIISKLSINSVIPNLDQKFNKIDYEKIYEFVDNNYTAFVEYYKTKLNVSQMSQNQKIHCYEYYQNNGVWNKKINEIVKDYNIKVSYFSKVPADKSNNIYKLNHHELIYDTLYLPVRICFGDH